MPADTIDSLELSGHITLALTAGVEGNQVIVASIDSRGQVYKHS